MLKTTLRSNQTNNGMKTVITICLMASVLALAGCQKDSSDSGNTPAPNNAPAAGMNTNSVPPTSGTNSP